MSTTKITGVYQFSTVRQRTEPSLLLGEDILNNKGHFLNAYSEFTPKVEKHWGWKLIITGSFFRMDCVSYTNVHDHSHTANRLHIHTFTKKSKAVGGGL